MIKGIYTALVTPFSDSAFGVQENLWRKLIERQIEAAIDGIVIAGSTGEGQTMYPEEWESALRMACEYREKIHIMVSVGSSATWQVIDRMKRAKELRAHSCLISSPPYNKPTQEGIVAHFRTIHEACPELPIMVYNIPGRTAVNISATTMKELWKIPSIHSLKESSGDWGQFLQIMEDCPPTKSVLSGDDPSALSFWSHGSEGLVSVLSNVAPKAVVKLWTLTQSGNSSGNSSEISSNISKEAKELFFSLQKLTRLLFCESNPIPTKYAVGKVFETELKPRLPLLPLSQKYHTALDTELSELRQRGLI